MIKVISMSLKKILLMLFIIGFITVGSVNAGLFSSDPKEVTVDGVNFVLDNEAEIIMEEEDMAGFKINTYAQGYIAAIDDDGLNSYIQNDTSQQYLVSKIDSNLKDIDEYSFVDGANNNMGYFLIFKKDNKQFIYQVYCDNESSISLCSALIGQFPSDNDMFNPK